MGRDAILPFFELETKTKMCYIDGFNDLEESVDEALARRIHELVRRAAAVGITYEEMQLHYQGQPDKLEAEIQRIINERTGAGWFAKMAGYEMRRKRIAAAYLAGVSLRQLGALEGVSTKAIHSLVRKELPNELRLRLSDERTSRGRRRAPAWTPTQASLILSAVSDTDIKKLPVTIIAARMVRAVNSPEASEDDESDPYLRDVAKAEATRHLPGQDRRGDGDGETQVRQERTAEGNS